ncbi:Hypothetical protein PBC10988_30670 [Planctomycetales bacterium 10988]|nr:Hypothetical protein PBC10988_30670 [Planctomycetales bacterium 10988]
MQWMTLFSLRSEQHRQTQLQPQKDTPLLLEQLESRQLLSADAQLIDINPSGDGIFTITNNSRSALTEMNGTLFFSASDGSSGFELWKSDSSGVSLVKDIEPGAAGSIPQHLVNFNGTLFFSAEQGNDGAELWMSDGTSGGTNLVKDINLTKKVISGTYGSKPYELTVVEDTLYFLADDGTHGVELWMTNGTSSGTSLVKDIRSGSGSVVGPNKELLTAVNDTLYFLANDGTHGYELWKSDSSGADLVKDINSGAGNGISVLAVTLPDGLSMVNVNGTLFFAANDGTYGEELWRSDEVAGAVLVEDINTVVIGATAKSSSPRYLANVSGTLYFSGSNHAYSSMGAELWKSNGTTEGTELVKDILDSGTPYSGSGPAQLTNINGTLYFSATATGYGRELWKSNGSYDGTVLVRDINSSGDSNPEQLVNVDGTLFFVANDGSTGKELWVSGGVLFSTQLIEDIRTGSMGSYPAEIASADGTIYFTANDGTNGRELWSLDPPANLSTTPIVTGTDDTGTSGTSLVRVFDSTGQEAYSFEPYASFSGGVRVATGDINGDGVLDIVTAPGSVSTPEVMVFDSETGELIDIPGTSDDFVFEPYGAITVGVFVAVGDVNGDGYDDIITSPDSGGGPHIKVFSGEDGSLLEDFYAYDPAFTGGVRIASGDLDGDGNAEIITGPGSGGGPHVKAFSIVYNSMTVEYEHEDFTGDATDFYAYDPSFLGGIYVASGDVDDDGFDDIITGAGATGGPHVLAFSGDDASTIANFYAYNVSFTGGVRVGAADINQDGYVDILTVPGPDTSMSPSQGPETKAFDVSNPMSISEIVNFDSGSSTYYDGLFVTGGLTTVSLSPLAAPFSSMLTSTSSEYPLDDETGSSEDFTYGDRRAKNVYLTYQALLEEERANTEEENEEEFSYEYDQSGRLIKTKAWIEELEEFYSQSEKVDELFSGLGIR